MPTRSGGTPERILFALFSEGFLDAPYIRNIYANSLRRGFFCNVETTCVKDPIIDVGCGLLGDSLLWGIRSQSRANNKKKSSKAFFLQRIRLQMKYFDTGRENANRNCTIYFLTKTCTFLVCLHFLNFICDLNPYKSGSMRRPHVAPL